MPKEALTKMEKMAVAVAWDVYHSCIENEIYIDGLGAAVEFLQRYDKITTNQLRAYRHLKGKMS